MSSPTCQYIALANPRYENPDDLPALLRRLADHIETNGIGPMDILDLTIESEMTADGPWWSGTVYWSPPSEVEPGNEPPPKMRLV